MLILSRYLKAVILTTYLCSLSHLVETRHMSDSEHRILEPRLDTSLSSLPPVAVRHQSVRLPNNISHATTHHKHRHKHNLIYNVNNSELINNLNSDKDIILNNHHHITNNDNNFLNKSPSSPSTTEQHIQTSRQFLLFNRCSHHYIYVFGDQIHARAKADNPFSLMSLETAVIDGKIIGIHIKSVNTGLYVCFNQKGKLVTRFIPDPSCDFREEVTHTRHIKYKSLYNTDWYLGFNKQGSPMKGKINSNLKPNQHRKRIKCYQFSKKLMTNLINAK